MTLKKCIMTNSTCYKDQLDVNSYYYWGNHKDKIGIVVHSTGANNPYIKRYVQPSDNDSNYDSIIADIGKNTSYNDWNHAERTAGVHAFIGKNINDEIRTYEVLPYEWSAWKVGQGSKGSYNYAPTAHIQFEICEDDLTDENYFYAVMKESQEYCAYLCSQFGWTSKNICCHAEAHERGYGSNHADIKHWLKKYGKTMDWYREEVQKLIDENTESIPEEKIQYVEYKIQKGDSLSKIAKANNTTVAILAELNNIADPNKIKAGATILIPVASTEPEPETKPEEIPTKEVYPGTASTGSEADAQKMWNFFLEKLEGNEYGVAGVLGNIEAESDLRSNNLQNSYEKENKLNMTDKEYTAAVDNGTYTNFIQDRAGYGLAQWTYWSRKEWLYNYAQECKKSIQDFDMQLDFLWKELSRDFKKVVNNLKNATSVREASDTMLLDFEKPANQTEENQIARANRSQRYYDKFAAPVVEQIPETQPPVTEPTPEQTPVVQEIIEKGTVVLLNPEAKTFSGNTIFFLFHLFKLYIKSAEVIDDKIVYTLGIFKDFSFFDFQTTEENFTVVKI